MKLIISFIEPEFNFILKYCKILLKNEIFFFENKKSYIYKLEFNNKKLLLANLNMGAVFSIASLQKIIDNYKIDEAIIFGSCASKKINLKKVVYISEFIFKNDSFQYKNIKINKPDIFKNLSSFKNISYDRIVKNKEIINYNDDFTCFDMEKSYISYVLKLII